ncbi:MAG: thioredoxin domain-containing protein [Cyanobacteria bacterium SBLK]|nr:thioredoxin domain-containing protein [Cyanobacteria bacterium SBLK]
MLNQTRKFFNLLLVCLWCLGLFSYTLPALADGTEPLEERVLSIIRNHPEVIIESVQNYQRQQQQQKESLQKAVLQRMKVDPQAFIGDSPTRGSRDEKIVLFMFSDFQCPFCALASETVKAFMNQYGDRVTLVYKHLPLSIHPQAPGAAKAAYAAGQQGRFWQYYDGLFAHQKELGEDLYRELAEDYDLDLEQFDRDRNSAAARAAIAADVQLAESLLIQGTPFFALNGKSLSGAVPLETFEKALKE